MRATLRGLAHERLRSGIGEATPFLLTRWSDGRMSLDDATTGRSVALDAFGQTNAEAFAKLFVAGERNEPPAGPAPAAPSSLPAPSKSSTRRKRSRRMS